MKRLSFNDVTPPALPGTVTTDKAQEIIDESKDKLLKIALLIATIVIVARYWLA